jgi:hypothetical protein
MKSTPAVSIETCQKKSCAKSHKAVALEGVKNMTKLESIKQKLVDKKITVADFMNQALVISEKTSKTKSHKDLSKCLFNNCRSQLDDIVDKIQTLLKMNKKRYETPDEYAEFMMKSSKQMIALMKA